MNNKNESLTLGSLFDGSGGFPLAGMLAGVTPVWASEIEPFAVRVTTARIPQMKHYGDVSAMNGADLPPVDIITFGSPCFPAGTLVLTDKGYLPIEEIKVGMKVLTHMGRWRKVTATGSKPGETVVLKGNHYGLECTPNHPIYSAELKRVYGNLKTGNEGVLREIGEEKQWTPAEEMQGKLWCVPLKTEYLPMDGPHYSGNKHQKPMPEMNEDFFYFVGRWLGDGWIRNTQRSGRPKGQRWGQIILCDSLDKEDELRVIVEKLTERYNVERCRTGVKFKFCSQVLCSWLKENFGEYAYGKKIPAWVYSLERDRQEALMKGFLDSDGYQSGEHEWKITSVSKQLVMGMRILAEILGYSTTVFRSKRPETYVIEGRTVNQRDTYVLGLAKSERVEHLTDELHGWYLVRKVIQTHEVKTVYNMTVEEDNSYVADGIVVHNCQDMSIAGKRAGLEGSRSNLFYEAIRIVKEMREKTNGEKPRFIVWENVPGAFSSNKGEDFKAVLEAVIGIKEPACEVPAPGGKGWPYADCYLGNGWSVAYRVLDAQYWGVPQRRARIFLVADFAGERAPEILFKSEGVSGYTPQGFRSWQGTAGNLKESAGETGRANEGQGIVLNDQGGNRMDITEEVTCTLRAEAHHPPVVMDEPQAFHINQRNEGIDLHGVAGALMATQNQQMQTFVVEKKNEPDAAGFCTEHSAKARGVGYEEEKSPTLRAGVVPAAIALEHHPTDSRIKIEEGDAIQTLTSRMGTGGNNVPLIMTPEGPLVPKTLKVRSGCDGGGKGALVQEDLSATLGCNNDQTVFVPFGICSKASNSMMSDNPNSGFYEATKARTLDQNGGRPDCSQGGIAIVAFAQNQRDEVRDLEDVAGAIAAEPGTKQQTYVLQGSMIGRADKNGPQGDGVNEDVSFTLNTTDRHAVAFCEKAATLSANDGPKGPSSQQLSNPESNFVCEKSYGIGRAAFNQGYNAQFSFQIEEEVEPTMLSRGPNAVAAPAYSMTTGSFMQVNKEKTSTLAARDYKDPPIVNDGEEPFYIVRRLTPVECARLQGFPDWWCAGLEIEDPTDEELSFWAEVWETHRKIMGTSTKPKTEAQLRKWLKNPHSDSAEYKLWGNGVALPCVYFVLSGIVWAAGLD